MQTFHHAIKFRPFFLTSPAGILSSFLALQIHLCFNRIVLFNWFRQTFNPKSRPCWLAKVLNNSTQSVHFQFLLIYSQILYHFLKIKFSQFLHVTFNRTCLFHFTSYVTMSIMQYMLYLKNCKTGRG